MLTINIISVGKIKEQFFKDAISEYSKRLSKYCTLNFMEIEDEKLPSKINNKIIENIKDIECTKIINLIKKETYLICLDLKGNNYSSEKFSELLDDIALNFSSNVTFVIGGTLGLTDMLLSKSDKLISFSKMTFPHQLIKVFLLEQLFRAFKISKGETYHW